MEAKRSVERLFLTLFKEDEKFVNFSARVKEDDSLKEKIIRQNYAKHLKTPEALFAYVSDILGCRIECRFNDDEEVLYRTLFTHFNVPVEDGYFASELDSRIALKLSEKQPHKQRNGFPIYKIDGRYDGEFPINFELQIKSIVNLFWGEIDHKILYKNYNYVITEEFVREIMDSINGSLSVIDKQMRMVYDHLKHLDDGGVQDAGEQIKLIIGRIIHDVYLVRFRDETGVVLDFRKSTELITDFLFAKVQYQSRENYAAEFVRLVDDALRVSYQSNSLGESIRFEKPIKYPNPETKMLGTKLEEQMNDDLLWNMILHILFDLTDGRTQEQEYKTFVDYLYFVVIHAVRSALRKSHIPMGERQELVDPLTQIALGYFAQDLECEYFVKTGLDDMKAILVELLDRHYSGEMTEAEVYEAFESRLKEQLSFGGNYANLDQER